MLKHKKFLSLLLVLPLFTAFSCTQVKETYTVVQKWQEDNTLTYTKPLEWNKPIQAPFKLDLSNLLVTFDSTPLENVTSINAAKTKADNYFICTSSVNPSTTIISNFDVNWTNIQVNTQLNFYLAHLNGEKIYLSDMITIQVINPGAFAGPWVIPVISIGVALIVVAMIIFTHRYKAKKEGKI